MRPGPRFHPTPAAWLGPQGFLLSEIGTLGVACYAAQGLWYQTRFPPLTWLIVPLVWILVSAGAAVAAELTGGDAFRARRSWPELGLKVALCSLALQAAGTPFSPRQAAAFGLVLGAALLANRVLLGLIVRAGRADRGEGWRFALAQGTALFAVHPYLRSALRGAGDAMSYSLTIADFLKQWRSGIFPVFIGQSAFAFSGGFQPLRNAPYLVHLAWAFDLLGLGSFNAFALLNLAVLASMAGGILVCYAALKISLPRGGSFALALALLYGLCPGVLAPLYGGDMYPTFMTLPFLPALVLGIEQSAAAPERRWPWALQGAALAAIWLAHPPIGAWATVLAGGAGLWTAVHSRRWSTVGRMLPALGIFLLLSAYLFVSVVALRLPAVSRAEAVGSVDYKLATLHEGWARSFLPVSPGGNNLLSDIQLGSGLWVCLLAAAAGALRSFPGRSLLRCFGLILLFAWPWPVVTRAAWGLLPSELLLITNQWPAERFYVLLAALSVFIIAQSLSRQARRGPWSRRAASVLLAAACLWSAAETRKFFRRGTAISRLTERTSEDAHRPENILLSRTHSYEYLGTPSYNSNGHMDPRLESRLLDRDSRRPFADGSTLRPNASIPPAAVRRLTLRRRGDGGFAESLRLDPGQAMLLRFDFLGRNPAGDLRIVGPSLYNLYTLPSSGSPRAFGTGPAAGHSLIVSNSTAEAETIEFWFIDRDQANPGELFAQVTAEPLAEADRAVRLISLTPFHARIAAGRACYLETPKLFVPGYRASVDGRPTPLARSPEGLVAIPLDPGEHDVTLAYVGSGLLRWSYAETAAAWLLVVGAAGALGLYAGPLPKRARRRWRSSPAAAPPRSRGRPWLGRCLVGGLGAAALVCGLKVALTRPQKFDSVSLQLRLPWPAVGHSEPLLTSGRTEAGDFFYVTYLDGSHLQVGHDRWNYGGRQSAPITVDYSQLQEVEIDVSPLEPAPPRGPAPYPARIVVRWNGRTVLTEEASVYPSAPDAITIGENRIGGSSALPHFSGEILRTERGPPARGP